VHQQWVHIGPATVNDQLCGMTILSMDDWHQNKVAALTQVMPSPYHKLWLVKWRCNIGKIAQLLLTMYVTVIHQVQQLVGTRWYKLLYLRRNKAVSMTMSGPPSSYSCSSHAVNVSHTGSCCLWTLNNKALTHDQIKSIYNSYTVMYVQKRNVTKIIWIQGTRINYLTYTWHMWTVRYVNSTVHDVIVNRIMQQLECRRNISIFKTCIKTKIIMDKTYSSLAAKNVHPSLHCANMIRQVPVVGWLSFNGAFNTIQM